MVTRGIAAACLFVLAGAAHADGLGADDLKNKEDGGYFTGLPLANYSTDTGYGYGGRVYYYYDGDRDDPRFAHTPYLFRVFLQGFWSTRGLQFHWLDFDAPKVFDTPYRLRSQLIYERNINQNYFGVGDRSLAPLAFPGAPGKTYGSFSSYTNDLAQIDGNGQTWSHYNELDLIRPLFLGSVERLFFHDRVRVLGGVGLSYGEINDYTGKLVDAASGTAPEGPTRLHTECQEGIVVGCGGGRDDFLRLGISYDTRDFEPDPKAGMFLDAALDAGTVALGSQYDYERTMVAARGYWSPDPDDVNLVLAGRGVFEVQTSGTPFFSMDTFPFTEDPRTGLGGQRTMRGYRQDRFVGPVYTLLNGEARWTTGHIHFWRQNFGLIIVPFLDFGRPYDSVSDLSVHDWKLSYGGAVRISWNLATIITVDYGRSSEDTGLYVNFNHMF